MRWTGHVTLVGEHPRPVTKIALLIIEMVWGDVDWIHKSEDGSLEDLVNTIQNLSVRTF
jgi:hypothetical protein